jgi:hypothetical protein
LAEKPFLETEYKNESGKLCPMVEVLIGERKVPILAYADSGCSTGIFILKGQFKDIDLGVKISDDEDPTPCIVADGHKVGADEYASTVYVDGERKEIIITVLDLERKLGSIPIEEMTPLLGRNFMDDYDVLFRGKEKKLVIFYPR